MRELIVGIFGIILGGIIGWISAVSLQHHIFKKEVYFKKKEEAFKILQLIDLLKDELYLASSQKDNSKIISEKYKINLNKLNNCLAIYFPDFIKEYEKMLVVHKNSEKYILLVNILYIDLYNEKINKHNEKLIKNLNSFQKKYNKSLKEFREQFLNYLKKEEKNYGLENQINFYCK